MKENKMASDWKLISCGEEHEMVYMLGKCGKELSNSNIKRLTSVCSQFKNDPGYDPHNRANFYKYLNDKQVIKELED